MNKYYSLLQLLFIFHMVLSISRYEVPVSSEFATEDYNDVVFETDEDSYLSKFALPVQNYLYKIKVITI